MGMRGIEYPQPAREDLVSLYESGLSLRSISERYEVSTTVVRRWFRLLEIPRRDQRWATARANEKRKGEKRSNLTPSDYQKGLRRKKSDLVKKYRNERGCQECGEKHPATLDLHHVDPTTKHERLQHRVSSLGKHMGARWTSMSFSDIAAELEKCIVLCSNCHRIMEVEEKARAST
jgi:transposase